MGTVNIKSWKTALLKTVGMALRTRPKKPKLIGTKQAKNAAQNMDGNSPRIGAVYFSYLRIAAPFAAQYGKNSFKYC